MGPSWGELQPYDDKTGRVINSQGGGAAGDEDEEDDDDEGDFGDGRDVAHQKDDDDEEGDA